MTKKIKKQFGSIAQKRRIILFKTNKNAIYNNKYKKNSNKLIESQKEKVILVL